MSDGKFRIQGKINFLMFLMASVYSLAYLKQISADQLILNFSDGRKRSVVPFIWEPHISSLTTLNVLHNSTYSKSFTKK